jgi:uncharacterized membrane protein YobD (UPF0266 family)
MFRFFLLFIALQSLDVLFRQLSLPLQHGIALMVLHVMNGRGENDCSIFVGETLAAAATKESRILCKRKKSTSSS